MKIKGGILCIGISMLMLFGFTSTAFAAATITGTVTQESDGAPVYYMYIYAENTVSGDISYDYSDVAGLYSITVDAGSYIVRNMYYSYDDTTYYYIQDQNIITILDGETITQNFSLTQRGRIEGYITESDGITPIHNATISATHASLSSMGGYDTSAISGYYLLIPQSSYPVYDYTLSSEGEYNLTITALNYFPTTTTATISNETTVTANASLSPASIVSGTIKDENGAAIEGASIALYGYMSSYYFSSSAVSASDGTYSFNVYNSSFYNGNAVGDYTLSITKAGYIPQTDAVSITSAEQNITDNNYSLIEGGTITGHIYGSDGTTPISGAVIYGDDGFGNLYSTSSATDGSYSLTSLRASENYILTVSKSNYVTKKKYHVNVEKGETTADQNINLADAITFSGTITDKSGNIIEGAVINLYKRGKARSSSADFTATSLSDGTFSFTTIVPDLYRIKVSKTGYVTYKKEKINLKSDKTDASYKLAVASSIYGRITNKGNGIENATIYVYGAKKDADTGFASISTDNEGYYRINNLKAGKYKIRVVTTNFAEKIITKKLKAGLEKEVNIKVAKAGSISGYATDKDSGIPLSGYYVRIKGLTNSAYTDYNGYYIIDGLSPGKYSVYLSSSLYGNVYYGQKILVKASQEQKNINFELTIK